MKPRSAESQSPLIGWGQRQGEGLTRRALIARPHLTLAVWLGFWGLMVLLTHVPLPQGGAIRIPHIDKVVHFGMYFLLVLLGAARLIAFESGATFRKLVFWGCLYGVYGVVDEVTQPWTHRTADLNDWLADALGIVVGTWIASASVKSKRLSAPKSDLTAACDR